jgi:hypothetical protein
LKKIERQTERERVKGEQDPETDPRFQVFGRNRRGERGSVTPAARVEASSAQAVSLGTNPLFWIYFLGLAIVAKIFICIYIYIYIYI